MKFNKTQFLLLLILFIEIALLIYFLNPVLNRAQVSQDKYSSVLNPPAGSSLNSAKYCLKAGDCLVDNCPCEAFNREAFYKAYPRGHRSNVLCAQLCQKENVECVQNQCIYKAEQQ